MIPVGSTAPRARLAIVVLAMVAACCGVFLWQQSLSTQSSPDQETATPPPTHNSC